MSKLSRLAERRHEATQHAREEELAQVIRYLAYHAMMTFRDQFEEEIFRAIVDDLENGVHYQAQYNAPKANDQNRRDLAGKF